MKATVVIIFTLFVFSTASFATKPSSKIKPTADLTDYFLLKHVVDNPTVRSSLLHSEMPADLKLKILQKHMNELMTAAPNPKNPVPETKKWRAVLGAKSSTTLLIADKDTIRNQLREGEIIQFDSNGKPKLVKAKGKLLVVKLQKIKFVDGTAIIKWVDGRFAIQEEEFGAGIDANGDFFHFESQNKLRKKQIG